MLGFVNFWSIVDKLDDFWHKFLRSIIYSATGTDSPYGGSLSNADAHALIDRAKLDFRDMREVGGLIVRRKCSHTKASARFARSLTDSMARNETISRVNQYSCDVHACVN